MFGQDRRDGATSHADNHVGRDLEPHLPVLELPDGAVETARRDDVVADLDRGDLALLLAHPALPGPDQEEPDDGEHDEDEEICGHVTPGRRSRVWRAPRPCSSGTLPARSPRARSRSTPAGIVDCGG